MLSTFMLLNSLAVQKIVLNWLNLLDTTDILL